MKEIGEVNNKKVQSPILTNYTDHMTDKIIDIDGIANNILDKIGRVYDLQGMEGDDKDALDVSVLSTHVGKLSRINDALGMLVTKIIRINDALGELIGNE